MYISGYCIFNGNIINDIRMVHQVVSYDKVMKYAAHIWLGSEEIKPFLTKIGFIERLNISSLNFKVVNSRKSKLFKLSTPLLVNITILNCFKNWFNVLKIT